jgi:two-component system response regulator YesN
MYNLLIVDDEPLVRRGIKELVDLKTLGIQKVFEAPNGEKAFEIFKSETIDIILLDINMPKLNGLSLAELMKQENNKVKIAMITGYDYFEYAVQALRVGVDEYILKPVSRKDIDLLLKKLITKMEENQKLEALDQFDGQLDIDTSFDDKLRKVVSEHLFDMDFSLKYLSKKMNLSSSYLSNIFKEIYGIPFQNYVLDQRIEKAKVLLIASDMKNYEIAEAIGYEDVNYFSTRFKKSTGMTPKQYKGMVQHIET